MSGDHLIDFDDADVPYELSRGQVIPYVEDALSGRRIYLTGVDAKYREAAGFGGFVEGRLTPGELRAGRSRRRGPSVGEDMAIGCLREMTEESMNVFIGTFTTTDYYMSRYAVVGDTLVVFLRLFAEVSEIKSRFNSAHGQSDEMVSNAYRETSDILAVSSSMMDGIAAGRVKTLFGIPVWSVYANLLTELVDRYGVQW